MIGFSKDTRSWYVLPTLGILLDDSDAWVSIDWLCFSIALRVRSDRACSEQPTNWDLFKDRAESLLRRWDSPKLVAGSKTRIKAFLLEVNDDYTKALLDEK